MNGFVMAGELLCNSHRENTVGFSFWFILSSMLAFAGDQKLARELDQVDPASMVDVIVHYKVQPSSREHANVTVKGAPATA